VNFALKTTAFAGNEENFQQTLALAAAYVASRDAITPNQDFIISAHPHCKSLFIATGGSFHGWKFLPILGKYVVEMLEGRLDAELAKKWAWDRGDKGSAHEGLVPRREMRDVM
jgi:sarcosine oxidase / L-pipecolate oxidase